MVDTLDKKAGRGDRQVEPSPRSRGAEPPAEGGSPGAGRARFRVFQGEGRGREETLRSRDDVVRLLVASAADMMLRRISSERMHNIQKRVDRVLRFFERGNDPVSLGLLRRELDDLESLWREGQRKRRR